MGRSWRSSATASLTSNSITAACETCHDEERCRIISSTSPSNLKLREVLGIYPPYRASVEVAVGVYLYVAFFAADKHMLAVRAHPVAEPA